MAQVRRLGEKEIRKVEASLADDPRKLALWGLSYYTALRAGEISKVRWRAVVGEENKIGTELRLPPKSAKKKSGRVLPIAPELRKMLARWRRETEHADLDDLIVTPAPQRAAAHAGNRGKAAQQADAIRKELARVFEACGLEACGSHTGRRSRLTQLSRANVNPAAIAAFAGHRDLRSTLSYVAFDDREMIDAISRVPARR